MRFFDKTPKLGDDQEYTVDVRQCIGTVHLHDGTHQIATVIGTRSSPGNQAVWLRTFIDHKRGLYRVGGLAIPLQSIRRFTFEECEYYD